MVSRVHDEFLDRIRGLEADVAYEQLQVQERDASIVQKDHEIQNSTSERDQYALQIARMSLNTPRNGTGSQAIPAAYKSTKIPDPPMLSEGKEPHFEDWLLLIKQKLAANSDHFDTPALCMTYIVSRTEGKAQRHLASRMRDNASNPYTDAKDIVERGLVSFFQYLAQTSDRSDPKQPRRHPHSNGALVSLDQTT
jgi:hypothetical protein